MKTVHLPASPEGHGSVMQRMPVSRAYVRPLVPEARESVGNSSVSPET